jgi:hypothetical protein
MPPTAGFAADAQRSADIPCSLRSSSLFSSKPKRECGGDKRPAARLEHAAKQRTRAGSVRFSLYYSVRTGKRRDEFAVDSLHRQIDGFRPREEELGSPVAH